MQSSVHRRDISGVGLGTFPFAGPFSPVSDATAWSIVEKFFELGGRYIDTAPTYGFGKVEKLLGEVLAGRPRDSFIISSCCGFVSDGAAYKLSGKPDDVRRSLCQSLERLRLDKLDVYFSHHPDPSTPYEQTAEALQRLMEEGVVGRIGVADASADQLAEYLKGGAISVVRNRFSFLNRELDQRLLQIHKRHKLTFVAYQVIERGLLTTRGPRLGANPADLRRIKPEFQAGRMDRIRQFVEDELKPVVEQCACQVESLAIRWCLSQPGVSLTQVGITELEQVERLPIGLAKLEDGVLARMEQAYAMLADNLKQSGFSSVSEFLGLLDPQAQKISPTGR